MKNSILKKFLSLMLAVLMLCTPLMMVSCNKVKPKDDDKNDDAAVLADPERKTFIDGIGGVSEKFKGAVSGKSYSSSDEAAKAFVTEELAGNGKANVSSAKSGGELSKKQIEALDIPADILEGSDSVEEIEIAYELSEDSSLMGGSKTVHLSSKQYTVKVYVIKYGVDWKYFAPMPVNGDTINKSYYDSVFDSERYKNSTVEATSKIEIAITVMGQSMTICTNMRQLVKHADGKIYIEQEISNNSPEEVTETKIYAYLEEADGKITCYVKMHENDDWIVTGISSIGFSSLDQLVPFHDQYLDYTYFQKTAYGFALSNEFARKYIKQTLSQELEDAGINVDGDDFKADLYAEYYVNEGTLSGMRMDADINVEASFDEVHSTIEENITSVITCTDYGTTVVNIPDVNK